MPKKKKYTEDFKREVVRLTERQTIEETARSLGIPKSAIWRWRREYLKQEKEDTDVRVEGPLTEEEREELKRLRRRNKELEMEHDFLKKAVVYFAKEKP